MHFLSEEFVSEWANSSDPFGSSISGLIVTKIENGPAGKISLTIKIHDGVIEEAYLGSGRGRDLELTLSYDLASSLFLHQADPASEYMKGNLKMSGDMKLWLQILPLWRERATGSPMSELAGRVTF